MRGALAILTQRASPPAYPRRRRRPLGTLGLVSLIGLVAVGAAACGGDPAETKGAPVVTVVTGLWPLAQAAGEVGQDNVRVLDVVPPGQDPLTYRLSGAEADQVRRAGLVVDIDAAFQPSFSAAASRSRSTLQLGPALGLSDPYVWLNPYRMERVGTAIERALVEVDPAARGTFANGLDNLEALLQSLDADYQSTLGVCPTKTIVTVGTPFAVLEPRYPVSVVGVDGAATPALPSPATVAHEVATVRAAHVHSVYTQPWYPAGGLIALEGESGVDVKTLDPLLGVPPGGWPKGTRTYFSRMEADLGVIAGALQCPNPAEDN